MPICIAKNNADGKYIVVELLGSLTHFSPMFHLFTPWKRQKTKGDIAMEKLGEKMG